MNNVVRSMVQNDTCSSCGVCAGLCPTNALSMKIQANGDLTPSLDSTRCKDNCQLCLDICPFSKGFHDPRLKNTELFAKVSNAKYDEDIGWYTDSFVGYRKDETLRGASSSGGLLTWCLEQLLIEGSVSSVAVIKMAKNNEKGYFDFYSASTIDELRQSAGSIYHPVEISEIVCKINSDIHKRWAIVGVPCLCAAIRNSPRLKKTVPFVFGLACGMYQNIFYTEMLLEKSGVDRENIRRIEYRRKSNSGPPSDYRFRGTDNHAPGKEVAYHGLPFYLGKNAFFRLNACNLCKDVFAETADACFMDAWLPEYKNISRGTSLVLIRNPVVCEIIEKQKQDNSIVIKNIGIDDVTKSQSGHIRRKRYLIGMRQGEKIDKCTGHSFAISDRLTWKVQKYTQKRSRDVWIKARRSKGLNAFWLNAIDIILIVNISGVILKTFRKASRFFNR